MVKTSQQASTSIDISKNTFLQIKKSIKYFIQKQIEQTDWLKKKLKSF